MAGNGMRTYAAHVTEGSELQNISASVGALVGMGVAPVGAGAAADEIDRDQPQAYATMASVDAETAAKMFVERAFASDDLPLMSAEPLAGESPEFQSLGVEQVPLTGTQIVKFRQHYADIPVYGSLVTVELGHENEFLALNSSLGSPTGVATSPSISADKALRIATGGDLNATDRPTPEVSLFFYYDRNSSGWRLVYIVKDVPTGDRQGSAVEVADVVVDAHDGEVVGLLPRVQSAAEMFDEATDALGNTRRIRYRTTPNAKVLIDDELRVETYDFGFRDWVLARDELPGESVANPPEPWETAAVSAHANAMAVARFIRDVLRREGLDGQGATYRSTVHCTRGGGQEWRNAAWLANHKQMIFGQRNIGGTLRSYAVSTDVVAHEMFHGLTSATARLEYVGMSGALNESFSDIFGVIISNAANTDVNSWNWQIGEDLDGTGVPLRDLKDPTTHGQPDRMSDYQELPPTEAGDWGGVHINSGIHNKAAYNLLTAVDERGTPMFTPTEVAAIFYLDLTQHLTRTSAFGPSRQGAVLAARSLFRNDPRVNEKVAAIEAAFEAVGITEKTGVG